MNLDFAQGWSDLVGLTLNRTVARQLSFSNDASTMAHVFDNVNRTTMLIYYTKFYNVYSYTKIRLFYRTKIEISKQVVIKWVKIMFLDVKNQSFEQLNSFLYQ